MTNFVYFQEHVRESWIRIGWTDGTKGRREDRQPDFIPKAVIQGCYDDEQNLHSSFGVDRVKRPHDKSTYSGAAVYEYVIWLLERGFAGLDRLEAESMPCLPWSVWGPESQRNEHIHGQLSLDASMPYRDRLAWKRHDFVHLSSESDDWYTPDDLIGAARQAMGSIDLDPASCVTAQRKINAAHYYTKAQNGLRTDLPWEGNIWLNPPYGRGESSAKAFVDRLVKEYRAGHVTQAVTCLNVNASSAHWFDPVWDHAAVHCVYRGRPDFWREDGLGSSASKGIQLSYFGATPEHFSSWFSPFGRIISIRENGHRSSPDVLRVVS